MAVAPAPRPAYRRRRPEDAAREILGAAESLLRDRPIRAVTVDELMALTSMSRPSFYQYFRDLPALVLRLLDQVQGELAEMAARWFEGTGDPIADSRAALEGVVEVYAHHGPLMRALADGATQDPALERAYRAMVLGFVDASAQRIREQIDSGRVPRVDAGETAAALVWMTERYLYESMAREHRVDPPTAVRTLHAVWVRALYLEAPGE